MHSGDISDSAADTDMVGGPRHKAARTLAKGRLTAGACAALVGFFIVAIVAATFSVRPLIEPDLSTYVLPAVERMRGFGVVYADFLDVKPPLIFAMFVPWFMAFGNSLSGIWVLYTLCLAALLTGFWYVLRQELSPWMALVLFASSSVLVVWTDMLGRFFFTTEVVGLALVMWGLVIASRIGQRGVGLAVATLLLTLAGQVKDVFVFLPLALLPLVWTHRRRLEGLGWWLLGGIAAGTLTLSVLIWWGPGALTGYVEVLGIKRARFPVPGDSSTLSSIWESLRVVSGWLPFLVLLVLALAIILLAPRDDGAVIAQRLRRSVALTSREWVLCLTLVTASAGFLWQGADLSQYYALAILYPLYLTLSVVVARARRAAVGLRGRWRKVATALLLGGLVPPLAALPWFAGLAKTVRPMDDLSRILASESAPDLRRYQEIQALANSDSCLQVAYGWDASAYYLYTAIPPCTRFTTPPIVGTPSLVSEMQQALIDRPPSLLVLDEGQRFTGGPTFFDQIARSCYQPSTSSKITFLRQGDPEEARGCIKQALR